MPYENVVMESFFSWLKEELTHHERFASLDEARGKVYEYIEVSITGSGCKVRWATVRRSSSRGGCCSLINLSEKSWVAQADPIPGNEGKPYNLTPLFFVAIQTADQAK